jgi:hypothetical protein
MLGLPRCYLMAGFRFVIRIHVGEPLYVGVIQATLVGAVATITAQLVAS